MKCCGRCTGQRNERNRGGGVRGCTCVSEAVIAERRGEPWCCETTPRQSVLNEADELIHSDRNVSYGPPMKNFERIADLWNTILGDQLKEPITTWQVADMSIAIKLARNIEKPKRDNYTDIAGYAACGWECAEGADCE